MHHTHQAPHHIPHRIALADDKPIQPPLRPKRGVEIPRLRHRVRSHQRFPDHEDFIGIGQLAEFLEIRHQARVVVAPAGGVDEHDVEFIRLRVRHGVFGDIRRVLAVSLFIQFHLTAFLALAQFGEVAGVDAQLFDGAGAEGVAGGDEEAEVVLEEEEGEFGEVGGFADAVDADYGDCVGAGGGAGEGWGGGDGVDGVEDVEGGCGGEDFVEGGGHGGADCCFDAWG